MRHKKKRILELSTGVQKKTLVIRNLLTSLIEHGQIKTTIKRAKVVKAEADSLFAKLVTFQSQYDEKGAKREGDRLVKSTLFTESAGKKAIGELLPKYISEGKTSGFVSHVKLGPRKGDAAEKVLVRLI